LPFKVIIPAMPHMPAPLGHPGRRQLPQRAATHDGNTAGAEMAWLDATCIAGRAGIARAVCASKCKA
jgi:hypothetical protein